MKFIQGLNRSQISLFPVSLEEAIDHDNEVRLIDIFVNSLNLKDFGFKCDFDENGRPAYRPADLLKLFIYGYLNKVRSSRDLERMQTKHRGDVANASLAPDHNTIANFRKDNPAAIKKVFRLPFKSPVILNSSAENSLPATAPNSEHRTPKRTTTTRRKFSGTSITSMPKLSNTLKNSPWLIGDQARLIREHLSTHEARKMAYQALSQELERSGEVQISTSDPDSRMLITRNNITEVAYNVQTTVDAKHNLLIDYEVTNENDSKAMGDMLQRAADVLGHTDFTALYDKGYHTGSELKTAQELGIETPGSHS
ncbi:MAG: transposase [Flavobacteriales bacterium]|nr:transposase [Flavobacteriales bacterium]